MLYFYAVASRFLLQLPLIVAHVLLITCVFLANSLTFGFSLDLPVFAGRKNFQRGPGTTC